MLRHNNWNISSRTEYSSSGSLLVMARIMKFINALCFSGGIFFWTVLDFKQFPCAINKSMILYTKRRCRFLYFTIFLQLFCKHIQKIICALFTIQSFFKGYSRSAADFRRLKSSSFLVINSFFEIRLLQIIPINVSIHCHGI